MSTDFRALQSQNRRSTWMLLIASFVLLGLVAAVVGYLSIGGWFAAAFAVVVASLGTFFSYRSSDRIALAATRAQPADRNEHARLHNVVEEMAIAAGIPKPAVYVVHDPAPNAFATGRDPEHAAIAATTGLIDKMDRSELQGVIAHEMAHIRNYDIRVMTVAVATAGAIAIIADIFWRIMFFGGARGGRDRNNNGGAAIIALAGMVFVAVLAPLAAMLLRAAVSRSREGLADASAVELTRNPQGLRRALEKLDADVTVVRRTSHATSHLWIESPDDLERGHKGRRFNSMFNTHPPLAERIDALRRMEGLAPYEGPSPAMLEAARSGRLRSAVRPEAPGSWAQLAGGAVAVDTDHGEVAVGEAEPGASDISRRQARPADGGRVERDGGALPAPGWYPDPTADARLRWWDGTGWTGFTQR